MEKRTSIHSVSQFGKIDVILIVDIKRELLEEEENEMNRIVQRLRDMLNKNSELLHPETIAQIAKNNAAILNCFPERIFVEEVTNEYGSYWMGPWFMVTTEKGRITVGWRKHVIQLDWSDTIVNEDADSLFPNENVTKFGKSIHADSYEKLKEYVNKLLSTE